MWKEVKVLKHHSHFLPMDINVDISIRDVIAVKQNNAVCWNFQQVETTEKCGFTGTGGADYNNDLTLVLK